MESKRFVLYFKLCISLSLPWEKKGFWNGLRQFSVGCFDWPLQAKPNLFASQPSNYMLDQKYLKATKVARNQHPHAV